MVVLIFAADHRIQSWNDVLIWSLVGLVSHLSLIPLISIGVIQSRQINNWKFDLFFLLLLGATRGLAINYLVQIWDLTQTVSYWYKVFNSTIALPQWFVGVAIFIESKRNYERAFREMFARAMRKEQETHERRDLLPNQRSKDDEVVVRLQFITSNLASDLQKLLNRPKLLSDYSIEAKKIQEIIDNDIRPTSEELWHHNKVKTPKIPISTLFNLAMLESRLKVFTVLLISVPYLFVGLNGAFGSKIALFQSVFVFLLDLAIFGMVETLHKLGVTSRRISNLTLFASAFTIPFYLQLSVIPREFSPRDDSGAIFWYQLLLSVSYIVLLFTVNGYSVIRTQRSEVLASLERHIMSERYNLSLSESGEAQHSSDLANYLHGEIQAGLTASSLLLQQAAESGDSELAKEALERASGLLNQDLKNISFTRMAAPALKIQKIVDAWKGIADISVALPSYDLLGESTLRSMVQLIEEAIANSIRHAHATDIKVSGVLKEEILTISIISNGNSMTKGRAGLGTKMLNDLTEEWNYSAESGHNRLTLSLINSIY